MSNTNVELFRKRFTSLREQSGLSIADLSNKTGISETGLRNYESKKENRMPRVFELIEIAKTFNVSTDYLLGLSDVPSRDTNIQAVCEFTGLSEKAVDNIRLINDYVYKNLTYEDWLKIAEANDIVKLLMSKHPEEYQTCNTSYPTKWGVILNTVIESNEFDEFIDLLCSLQDESAKDFPFNHSESLNQILKDTENNDERFVELVENVEETSVKKIDIYNKCDLIRYKLSKISEKIFDIFDKREKNQQ